MTTLKRFPLLALLLLCSPARAWVSQGGIASSFNPQDYHDGKMYGPLSPDQQTQYEAWQADQRKGVAPKPEDASTPPQTPSAGNAADTAPVYANQEAAKVNNLDGALVETGLGTNIDGQLPAGSTLKDINGRRYYCDTGSCTLCSSADCAGVIPPQNMPVNNTNTLAQNGGNLTGGLQTGGGLRSGKGLGRGVGRSGSSGVGSTGVVGGIAGNSGNGENGSTATGGVDETGGTAGNNGGGANRRGDEPKPRTISALVQDMVLPAVDTLASGGAGGENGIAAGGGAGGTAVTGVAGKTAGGAPQVRYSGGSFDSLSDINNSKALGDAGKMLGDGATGGEALKAGRSGKQSNNFGATKGDNQ